MTSDTWPYSLDLRGFPIITCFLRASSGEEILVWKSHVVLPQTTEFNYEKAAYEACWSRVAKDRWRQLDGLQPIFIGDARALCFYIGVGPDWEAWGHKKYRERLTS